MQCLISLWGRGTKQKSQGLPLGLRLVDNSNSNLQPNKYSTVPGLHDHKKAGTLFLLNVKQMYLLNFVHLTHGHDN